MGLLSELLLLPLAPARLALWTVDRVIDAASREYNDPTAVRRALAELNRQFDAGSISAEEFDRREDELLDRLYGTPPQRGPS
jgi:Gas vesicle protein G